MNLSPGSIYSWEELYARFTANFASAYQQHGVEAHLHAVRQEPGETLRAFISRFTKVRGTIPHISDASIITAFRQGVRDEKMLEKLATHDVETVSTLFTLADKCARAAEGRAWHSAPQTEVAQTEGSGAVTLKGKCALGPFLSILVIECQHKWSCVNLCQMMDKVKINKKVCF
jgi:hypothetical protein